MKTATADRTVSDIKGQRAALEREAQKLKRSAIEHVLSVMDDLGVTPGDLGLHLSKPHRRVKYRSPEGYTWTGVGQRPRWVVAKLIAGHDLEEFRVKE